MCGGDNTVENTVSVEKINNTLLMYLTDGCHVMCSLLNSVYDIGFFILLG